MAEPLLNYSIGSDPNPLQAGEAGALTILLSNPDPGNPVTVFSVSLTIAIGDAAADLAATKVGIRTPKPAGWSAEFKDIYTAKPEDPGGAVIRDGMALEITDIPVNPKVGATIVYIDEEASDAAHPRDTRSCPPITLAKFPARFRLSELTAAPDPVVSGRSVTLSWSGSNFPGLVTYMLEWVSGGEPRSRNVSYVGPEIVENVDTEPHTKFKLTASIAGAPPASRVCLVDVLPRAPVIDKFRGDIVGNSIILEWSVSYADDVEIGGLSEQLRPVGTRTLTIDRFRYTLTARNKNRSASASLDVKFVRSATGTGDDTSWEGLVAQPDGSLVLAMAGYRECSVFDGVTLRRRNVAIDLRGYGASGLAISAKGRRTFAWSLQVLPNFTPGPTALLDSTFQVLQRPDLDFQVLAAAFSPDETWLFVVHKTAQGRVILRKHAASDFNKVREQTFDLGWAYATAALAFSPRGDQLFFFVQQYQNAMLIELDPNTGTETRRRGIASSGNVGMTLLCWQNGTQLLLALASISGQRTFVYDLASLNVLREFPWRWPALTATEILGACYRGNQTFIDVVDRTTFALEQSIALGYPFSSMFEPVVVASRAIYHAAPRSSSFHRYEGRTAERVGALRAADVRATPLRYDLLRSDSTLVVVASADEDASIGDALIEIEIAGDDVSAEAPEGWSVAREGTRFLFQPAEPSTEPMLAFTFRNAPEGRAGIRETRRRTLELNG